MDVAGNCTCGLCKGLPRQASINGPVIGTDSLPKTSVQIQQEVSVRKRHSDRLQRSSGETGCWGTTMIQVLRVHDQPGQSWLYKHFFPTLYPPAHGTMAKTENNPNRSWEQKVEEC